MSRCGSLCGLEIGVVVVCSRDFDARLIVWAKILASRQPMTAITPRLRAIAGSQGEKRRGDVRARRRSVRVGKRRGPLVVVIRRLALSSPGRDGSSD